MPDTRTVGFGKEDEACAFLKKRGYKILERNFRTLFGEIDIIACRNKDIVFIEVKYRKSSYSGTPQEAVNKSKQQKIIKSALAYMKQAGNAGKACAGNMRFDIVAANDNGFEIIESAFTAEPGDYYF